MFTRRVFDEIDVKSSNTVGMLPDTIIVEIFNLKYHVNEMAIGYICDELSKFGCHAVNILDYDLSVTIYFQRPEDSQRLLLDGELRIDRVERRFEVAARYGAETILPVFGEWETVEEYLRKVLVS